MRAGISMWSLVSECRAGRMDVAAFMRFAAHCGVEGVELLDYFWHEDVREAPLVLELARQHGLTISAYAIGNDFVQFAADERARELGRVRAGVDMAGVAG